MPNNTPPKERERREAAVVAAVAAGFHTMWEIGREAGLAQSPTRSCVVRLCLSKKLRRSRSTIHTPSGPVWTFHLPKTDDVRA